LSGDHAKPGWQRLTRRPIVGDDGEPDAPLHHLAAATGLGGRSRRLGDHSERARKAVSARVRDAETKPSSTGRRTTGR